MKPPLFAVLSIVLELSPFLVGFWFMWRRQWLAGIACSIVGLLLLTAFYGKAHRKTEADEPRVSAVVRSALIDS